ncbi:MAG: uroporphyrinogen-III synthase [Planctomycetaceae bacterium]
MPPLRVCSFESRRRDEMESLLRRQGADCFSAPSMQEVPLDDQQVLRDFHRCLIARNPKIDGMIFLTGVGATALFEVMASLHPKEEFVAALNECLIVVRGPKPIPVLKEWGVRIDLRAPEPNTWREVLSTLDAAESSCAGKLWAIQEYGKPSQELADGLRERGAEVLSVPVYRWKLPDDLAPLRAAIQRTIAGDFDMLLFTTAQQLEHILVVSAEMECREKWLAAAGRCVIASIGPTTSIAIQEHGLTVSMEPSHAKMGQLVVEACRQAPELLSAIRGRSDL